MHLRKALNVCNPMYVLLLCHGLAVANDRHCAERGSDRLLLEIGVCEGVRKCPSLSQLYRCHKKPDTTRCMAEPYCFLHRKLLVSANGSFA